MLSIAVVDYGMGNLDSVVRALEECGATPIVTHRDDEIARASALVLPGVGAFATGMRRIRERGLDETLHEHVGRRGVPTLGLCLGMHLLATTGHEGGETQGLGWIPGNVVRLDPGDALRVPHVGWNEVVARRTSPLLDGVDGRDFYFVHSYELVPHDDRDVLAVTQYGRPFASVVGHEHVVGVQFHPEKSQRVGLQLLRNFVAAAPSGAVAALAP